MSIFNSDSLDYPTLHHTGNASGVDMSKTFVPELETRRTGKLMITDDRLSVENEQGLRGSSGDDGGTVETDATFGLAEADIATLRDDLRY